ncbi:MAG TPA: prolyl oligopeptidase family serine peptidase [Candidatus Tyrphobacter sp.]
MAAAAAALLAAGARLAYPPTPTDTVVETYWGHRVADPYRWLENAADPKVRAWAAAQSSLALGYIQRRPAYAHIARRVAQLSRTSTARFGLVVRHNRFFYLRETPPQPQAQLVVRNGLNGTERVLFDPQAHANGGAPPAIEAVFVAPSGDKVAFTTQQGGSEDQTLHVVDATTGRMLADVLPHVGGGTSGVALAWDANERGFIHTQWPQRAGGTFATSGILIYHHVLGAPQSTDGYVFGRGLSARAEYALESSLDGRMETMFETDGDGVHASVYLRKGSGAFARVATPNDGIGSSGSLGGEFVGDALDVISQKGGSRGEVVSITSGSTFATGRVVVPQSALVIEGVNPVPGGFITADVDGGDARARFFTASGRLRATIPIPPISTLTEVAADPRGGAIVIGYANYTTPNTWLRYDSAANTLAPTGVAQHSPGDFSHVVAERVFVPSLDGTARIPLEIVHERGIALDGRAPTILTAYGAYGSISRPRFNSALLAWLERGGVYAQAMIRGGGEYGEAWHLAARHATKTKSSDDVDASARWLGAHGYGGARHIGIIGGSAGGFLMGLALTRNPGDYRAVVSQVGIYDLLRVELTPNGAYNTPEFGTVKDPAQFLWMLRQSPYHNVVRGRAYPAVLMTTGENDPRVDPYNSRKMIARLQADSSSPYPILLIQRAGQGHGIGNSFAQQVEQITDVYTFFDSQLR